MRIGDTTRWLKVTQHSSEAKRKEFEKIVQLIKALSFPSTI